VTGEPLETVSLPLQECHRVSVALLSFLDRAGIDPDIGMAGMALTMGRLWSPEVPMKAEDEVAFVQAITEWGMLYFLKGEAN
jgi:hypothetical protein